MNDNFDIIETRTPFTIWEYDIAWTDWGRYIHRWTEDDGNGYLIKLEKKPCLMES